MFIVHSGSAEEWRILLALLYQNILFLFFDDDDAILQFLCELGRLLQYSIIETGIYEYFTNNRIKHPTNCSA